MNGSLIEKFWTDFCNNHGISKSSYYEAYSFGDPESADYIADLVKNGIKTATSSALELYHEGEGNRSYEYWHNAHVKFFNAEFKSANKVFTDSSPIVCEVFELIK